MFPRPHILAAVLAFALAVSLGRSAQVPADFDAQHAEAASHNPPGLHLQLALAGGRTQFHPGELIKVEYQLTADEAGKYRCGYLWHDLSERSRFESFVSDRPGDSSDPLTDHWSLWEALYDVHVTRRTGFLKKLSQTAVTETWDLNDYLRFDNPGRYRVYAVTRHVVTDEPHESEPYYQGGAPLVSNILELEILPDDPAWSADTLQHALDTFTLAVKDVRARTAALKTIRFLQTPAALHAMASHYSGTDREADLQFLSGMIGYHDLGAAVKRMEAQLAAPDFGVTRFYLFSLGVIKLQKANPSLTGEALRQMDKSQQKQWRHALFDVLMPYYEQLIPGAETKTPKARALTVDTLFHTSALESFAFERLPLPAEQVEALRRRELAILPDLPHYEQLDRVGNFGWAASLPPEQVLPVLRKIYEHPAGVLAGDVRVTRNFVLKDVNKISPEEGQKLLAEAITEPNASMTARDVSGVPLTPSPALDDMLIAKLEGRRTEEMKSAAPLIGQYASPALLERVRAVYEVEREAWPCDIEAGLLAYFLRVDEPYGAQLLPPALAYAASRERITCQRPSLLGAISELYYSPQIEKLAIAQLDDPSSALAQDAVRSLAAHPSPAAYAAILDRLRRFHEEWKGFDKQKSPPEVVHKWDATHQAGLGIELIRALARSPEYRHHPDKLAELAALCVTDTCRAEIQRSK